MKSSLCTLLLCMLIFCACSSAIPVNTGITSTPTATKRPTVAPRFTPTPTATPRPARTPTPTALPLPTGTLPGWYKEQSLLWSGYSSPQGGILGIRSQWIEPQASGGPNSEMFMWIGVGGWDQTFNELIQIGTLAYTDEGGNITHQVWYETVPQLSQLTSMSVSPGDKIFALMELDPGSSENWTLSLADLTQNTSFSIKINYPSSQVYGDFIVEDPRVGSTDASAPLYPFQQFTPVSFTGAQVHYANGWYSIAALQMMQITMVQQGQTVAYPGNITAPDSFTVTEA